MCAGAERCPRTRTKSRERTPNPGRRSRATNRRLTRPSRPLDRLGNFGLTSSDIVDTARAVQMVQSAGILVADAKELRNAIARRAREHMLTPCIGRSHGIHAEPTTFGLKLALMYDEFGRAQERLERALDVAATGRPSGAVGTSAHRSPAVEGAACV